MKSNANKGPSKSKPNVFSYIFLLSIFCDYVQVQELFPVLAKVHFQEAVIGFSLIGVLVVREHIDSLIRKLRRPQSRAFLFLVFWMVMDASCSN